MRSTSGQTGLTTRVRVQLLPFPLALLSNCILTWEFPIIRATLFWGPYDKDPTIWSTILLGFGVPYFNTFFLKGTLMKYKFILFSPWLLQSPVRAP